LDGDATGGGHRSGTGNPGKSEFPKSWSDDKIIHEISDIATDPTVKATQLTGPGAGTVHPSLPAKTITTKAGNPVRYKLQATRGGIDIEVIVEPGGKGIVTGYPTGGTGVITNP
jgi:hypothetical protein